MKMMKKKKEINHNIVTLPSQPATPATTTSQPTSSPPKPAPTAAAPTTQESKPQAPPEPTPEEKQYISTLAYYLGIPQIVEELKKQREMLNALTSQKQPEAAGAAAIPGIGKLLESPLVGQLIGAVTNMLSGGGGEQAPTLESSVEKELMQEAIKVTIANKKAATTALELIVQNMMRGGQISSDGKNVVVTQP